MLASDPELKNQYNPDVNKEDLYEKARGLYGDDLKKVVTDSLKRTSTSGKESVVKGDGDYLDDEDLIEKYLKKGKEKQYAAIKKNAHSFYDEQRECYLWEDVSWKTRTKQTQAEKTEVIQDIEQESKMKPKAKPKPKKEVKTEGQGGDEEEKRSEAKLLSGPQLARIKKEKDCLGKIVVKVG